MKKNLVPRLLKAHFLGDIRELKPWCGEAVYHKLAADIRARKADGIVFDSNILSIDENQLIFKLVEDMGPVIVAIYMVQQINCIRNKEGEIIEVCVKIDNYSDSVYIFEMGTIYLFSHRTFRVIIS